MKILLLDIETAPNLVHVWGLWGQNISIHQIIDSGYVLCWAAKWLGEDSVMFDSLHTSNKRKMLKRIYKLLEEADAVVHYNGSRFDIPTLNKEFLLMGFTPPAPYKQIDLLKTARQQFRFPSNKLDYIAKSLGLEGKKKHAGHELWIKCMANDAKAWEEMESYNVQDVKLLEDVYFKLLPWITAHPSHGLYGDSHVCPNCGSVHLTKRGFAYTTLGKYQRYKCDGCGKWSRSRKAIATKTLASA